MVELDNKLSTMCRFQDCVGRLGDLGLGISLCHLKMYPRKPEENETARKKEDMDDSAAKDGTSSFIFKVVDTNTKVSNEIEKNKERIVGEVEDNGCREDKGRKE